MDSLPDVMSDVNKIDHHTRLNLCKTRPAYRQGRKLTAVKAYTINNESQHLFVYGVPQINLRSELKSLCSKYGKVTNLHVVNDREVEIFTECYHVQYDRIQSARIAKRLIDDRSFYGSILHVCYAPECENVNETKQKLLQRCKDVSVRLPNNNKVTEEFMHPANNRTIPIEDSNYLGGEIDIYENDPIMIPNFRKRKCRNIKDDSTSSVSTEKDRFSDVMEADGEKQREKAIEINNLIHKSATDLIPVQVLKYKCNVDRTRKRIIFHNKNIT